LTIVLSFLPHFWPLYCLAFLTFDHCNVWPSSHNGQKWGRPDNTMVKSEEGQTIQWSKVRKARQYNGQMWGRPDNTMVKSEEGQTIQWSKVRKARQYNGQKTYEHH
jgi:ABC-type Fe2+-enterobactin transport system substrate-binding protein